MVGFLPRDDPRLLSKIDAIEWATGPKHGPRLGLLDAAALWLLSEGGVSPDLPTLRLLADHPGWAASCARTVNRPPTV
jgi:hypothetical protein